MSAKTSRVKVGRNYDASRRQARAQEQRALTLDVAQRRFLADGYAATTVEAIAVDAGISPATIYKSYGGKAGLVRTLCQMALEGSGPVPAEERSNALRGATGAQHVIAGWGALRAEVSPRISPLLLLLRDAARDDAEAAALYDELDRARLRRMSENAKFLFEAGYLRVGVSAATARDVLWLSTSAEMFDLLVRRRGWSVARYSQFMDDMVVAELL